ncbi:MAG: hypothetical protein EXX96DRAFT_535214 [Benjaminiella poitrasii]|nr:MAG: hypothetical protein EXX96DRAFT_535214 [Benjaminiella poitrasii]
MSTHRSKTRNRVLSLKHQFDKLKPNPILFIDDRGTRVSSRSRDFRRYSGKWKEEVHGQYKTGCNTNKNITSRIFPYYFSEVVRNGQVVKPRDELSFLATSVSGLAY